MLSSRHLRRLAVAGTLLCAPLALTSHAKADGFSAVQRAARAEGVPVRLALAVAKTESGGNCRARSGAGAIGVMQTLPRTAAGVGVRGGLQNCERGAIAGVRYLAQCLRAARGSWAIAAHFYNAGTAARPRVSRYASLVMSRVR